MISPRLRKSASRSNAVAINAVVINAIAIHAVAPIAVAINSQSDPLPRRLNEREVQQPGEPQPGSAPPQMLYLVKCDSQLVLEDGVWPFPTK